MSSSLKERIISALCVGGLLFIMLCVIYKLFNYREDWLSYSATWAIFWAIGHFVAKSIALLDETSIGKILLLEAIIVFLVAMFMAFIFGVIIELPTWKDLIADTCIPFGAALLINNKWKRD